MINRTEQKVMESWNGDMNKPAVSICTITYNHEKYITEALDSFLMQKTNFPFEILIDDDCSTDNAVKVIKKYMKKFPNIIKVNLREKNIGPMANFIGSLKRAKGKYIALCEGDDYWTDPLKLQKQVDFLESHEEYNMVFHNAEVQDYTKNGMVVESFNLDNASREYFANEIMERWCVATASVLCRNEKQYHYLEHNPWFPVGDHPYFIKCASMGKIYCIAEQMSVYRRVPSGFLGSGKTHSVEFRLTFIRYLKTLYSDFSDLLSKEMMDNKIALQYFWTAYRFKITGHEKNSSQYMQLANPQVIFEELIQTKDKKIKLQQDHIEFQDKTIHELKEKLKKIKNKK